MRRLYWQSWQRRPLPPPRTMPTYLNVESVEAPAFLAPCHVYQGRDIPEKGDLRCALRSGADARLERAHPGHRSQTPVEIIRTQAVMLARLRQATFYAQPQHHWPMWVIWSYFFSACLQTASAAQLVTVRRNTGYHEKRIKISLGSLSPIEYRKSVPNQLKPVQELRCTPSGSVFGRRQHLNSRRLC